MRSDPGWRNSWVATWVQMVGEERGAGTQAAPSIRKSRKNEDSPYRWDTVDRWELGLRNQADAHFLKAEQNGQVRLAELTQSPLKPS